MGADSILKWIVIGSAGVVIVIIGFFMFTQTSSTPNATNQKKEYPKSQARKISDQGRSHVEDISGLTYNSNPPTSGPHFASWAQRGVYNRVIADGHLIHSLEHGYVVLSYNCGEKGKNKESIKYEKNSPLTKYPKQAGGGMANFTPINPPKEEEKLPESFKSDSCRELVGELGDVLSEFHRVIIVPRPSLDTMIALTAWNQIDKMGKMDITRIKSFIAEFENQGPEKTIE